MAIFKKLNYSMVVAFLVLISPIASAQEGAVELLNRMNQALHQLSYKGTLAYLRGNSLSTLYIEHSVVNGKEIERVVRLNEAGGEVSRELKGFSLASIPKIRPEMEKVYSFDMGRKNRVADMPCRIITARPKDRKRYLQKYCIHTNSGMLLDYMLVGKSHKPVEQFMFTNIEIKLPEAMAQQDCVGDCGTKITELGVTSLETTRAVIDVGVNSLVNPQANVVVPPNQKKYRQIVNSLLDDGWVMEALPEGYEINQAPHIKEENEDTPTKHYVLSDGLSSFSVFVAPYTENNHLFKSVKINSGALNIVTRKKENHIITAVGEVPEATLKDTIENLRRK